jgi:hypothetical protein
MPANLAGRQSARENFHFVNQTAESERSEFPGPALSRGLELAAGDR